MYRAARPRRALGLPVAELTRGVTTPLAQTRWSTISRSRSIPANGRGCERRLPFPEFEESFFLIERARRRGHDARYGSLPMTPEYREYASCRCARRWTS